MKICETWRPEILVSDLAMPHEDGYGSSHGSARSMRTYLRLP